MINIFGKHSYSILAQKKSFFDENEMHVKAQKRIAEVYCQQPKRVECKACSSSIKSIPDITKLGVGYEICENCGHLNGIYEDTEEYCRSVYVDDGGSNYAANYGVDELSAFNSRVTSIYLPKAEFLRSNLLIQGEIPERLRYFDFGAGSGFFISALKRCGLTNSRGSEVSQVQVLQGNKFLNENLLATHRLEDTVELLRTVEAEVVSMIGVLEHLQSPLDAIQAIQNNPNVKYFYYSVPTFGLSVFIEGLRSDIFHRHLQGGHTHLYTKSSLETMEELHHLECIAEWAFGSDLMDLYRFMRVDMEATGASKKAISYLEKLFSDSLDNMQIELDKAMYGSEVHRLVVKK